MYIKQRGTPIKSASFFILTKQYTRNLSYFCLIIKSPILLTMAVSKTQMTSKEFFNSLNILHLALIVGVLMFMIVAIYLNFSETKVVESDDSFSFTLQVTALVLTVSSLTLGSFITKKRLTDAQKIESFTEKIGMYRGIMVLKYALIEGPALACTVFYLITGDFIFLALGLIMLFLFVLNRPTKEKAILDLDLKGEERERIYQDDEIIADVYTR